MKKTQNEINEEYKEAGMPLPAFEVFIASKKTFYRCKKCGKKYKTLKGMRSHYFRSCKNDRNIGK